MRLRFKVRGFSFPFHAAPAGVAGRGSMSARVAVPNPKTADLKSRSRYDAHTSSSDRPPCLENSCRAVAEFSSLPKTATLHFPLKQDNLM